jgi:MSHA biogenesis protein MshJ
MMSRLRKLEQRIDALTLRERLFLLAAGLAIAAGLWESLLTGPLAAREQRASKQVAALQQQLAQINDSIGTAAEGMNEGMAGNQERLELLRKRVDAADEEVRVFTSDLVDPAQMRLVLEDLIRQQQGLKLLSLNNIQVRPMLVEDKGVDGARAGATKLYRHGVTLVVEGSYLQCLEYLSALEHLPWQLYWARLELEAGEYPANRILIELHTLSLEEDWIGV